jgi:myo-inositol-1(or 4)-monophosphatase
MGVIMSTIDLPDATATAIQAARTAGDLVRDKLFRSLAVQEKGHSGDVVTELDLAAEKSIIATIRARFPGHRIVSEEIGNIDGDDAWTWLIDPVDGTNNVVVGLPVLAIGITLCHDDAAVASVVHDPVSRRTWSAIRDVGAWNTDGDRMVRHPAEAGHKPVLAWIQGYTVPSNDRKARALKLVLASRARRVLDLWAPLTCWMMLARGDIDGIVGYQVGELDLHGGALIASEAGLIVQTFAGAPFEPRLRGTGEDHRVIAGPPAIVRQLTTMLASADRLADPIETTISHELVRPAAAPRSEDAVLARGREC